MDVKIKVKVFALPGYDEAFTLDGFNYSDTIYDVKSKICKKLSEFGLALHDPDRVFMVSSEGPFLTDDHKTLGSYYPEACQHDTNTLSVLLFPYLKEVEEEAMEEGRWLSRCRKVREEEEAKVEEWERKREKRSKRRKMNHGYPDSVSEARPKTKYLKLHLPYVADDFEDLGIDGNLHLYSETGLSLPVEALESAHSVRTSASVVLLAPNDHIWETLRSLPTFAKSKYLIIRVSWDELSYLVLRAIKSFYPHLPFVAVTDLDPHHLHLLTFLDTPVDYVDSCYGWEIPDLDTRDQSFLSPDYLDIKWLGLRPCQLNGHLSPPTTTADASDDDAACPGSAAYDFRKVIRMLKVNPCLRSKEEWLKALDWLDHYGKSVPLKPHYFNANCILEKLSAKDWV